MTGSFIPPHRCIPLSAAQYGIFTSLGAQSAIRNPPKARRCCNPPQSAIRHVENAKSRQAFEPGT
eukprot:5136439-Alexandrium_andersonii.AAC.1